MTTGTFASKYLKYLQSIIIYIEAFSILHNINYSSIIIIYLFIYKSNK